MVIGISCFEIMKFFWIFLHSSLFIFILFFIYFYFSIFKCQIALPCMDYECFNGGKCNNILIDTTEDGTGIYKAKCECLDRAVHGVAAVFRGTE